MKNKTVLYLCQAGVIAAVYFVLVFILQPISFGALQVRVAEALTLMPALMPGAIPGLTIGCFLTALLPGSFGAPDMIFGTLASLLAATSTYFMRKLPPWLLPLPSILFNAIIVGAMISKLAELPLALTMLEVGAGQMIATYVLGLPLFYGLRRTGLNQLQPRK